MQRNRFLIKSLFYRGWSTILTFFIAYLLTGRAGLSGGIALTELLLKTLTYYIFEIIWNRIMGKRAETIWFNGLSGAGKTTIGEELEKYYKHKNKRVFILDGDVLRDGLNVNLGFSVDDRMENLRRASEVAKILNQNGVTVIATFITPTNEMRYMIKSIISKVKFVHLETPLDTCEERDVKGLYAKARTGEIKNFTGIDSPFEDMPDAWMKIDTTNLSVEETVQMIIHEL